MSENRRKIILFYNPSSGNGLFKHYLDDIIGRCQDEGYMVVPIRAGSGRLIYDYLGGLDQSTYRSEYNRIIVAGGDGTLNECVNAMIANDIDLPLAIMPAGTANDFAYYFNIPDDIIKELDIAMGSNYTYADVGKVNEQYFINVAAIGTVIDVSQKTDPTLKNTLGIMAYYIKGLQEVPNLKPVKVTLTTPDKTYHERMYFMVVMNGKSAGGFKNIAPESNINDGQLDVLLFRDMSFIELPSILMKIMQGNHPSSKKVLHFRADKLIVDPEEDMPTDIDGEHGASFPLEFSVLHNRMKIMTLEENMGAKREEQEEEYDQTRNENY